MKNRVIGIEEERDKSHKKGDNYPHDPKQRFSHFNRSMIFFRQ